LTRGFVILFRASFSSKKSMEHHIIETLTKSSQLVRAEGIGSLAKVRETVKYELLRDGMSLIINDFSPDEIRHNLTAKVQLKQNQMQLASHLFENMSKVCPAMGMMGTLIGLAKMLADMSDPSTIGGGMAMAIIGTLYGLMTGTVLYAPFGEKISLEAESSLSIDSMVIEGVLSLKAKKSSIHFKDIVATYGSKAPKGGAPREAKNAS
jgi:chemotaxis protein MotA